MHKIFIMPLLFVLFAWPAFEPSEAQSAEELCNDSSSRTEHVRVRVAWTPVETSHDDVRVSYCVLHGEADAKLAFERDAEIVYFALANVARKTADRRPYTFVIRTSTGRVLRQGPAVLKPLTRQPLSCRVDVCQFFTEPGERVISASVESGEPVARR